MALDDIGEKEGREKKGAVFNGRHPSAPSRNNNYFRAPVL
jgi:hypothetical protein